MMVFDQLRRNDPHLRVVTVAVLSGLLVLLAGLWWVQVVSHRHYTESQKNQSFRTVRIPAMRGKILDRHGAVLAESQPSYNVILYLEELRGEFKREWARTRPPRTHRMTMAQRRLLESQTRYRVASNVVQQVSAALGQPIPFAYDYFMRHYTNQLALPVPILRNLNPTQVARLLEGGHNPPGIDLEVQPLRHYPEGRLACHVLGYVLPDNSSVEGEVADFNFRLPDYRGHVGVEGQHDAALRGRAGVKSVLVNSLGYRQSETIWTPADPGRNVVLTLDADIQRATEQALQSTLANVRGAAIVMDPKTGDLLALASAPTYDPNWFIPRISREHWNWLSDTNLKPQMNRPIYASYAPGSVFKILTGLAALEHGLDPAERMQNPGWIKVAGRLKPIDDMAEAGEYDFRRAFIKSSNTYFISNGIRHGNIAALAQLAQRLHLGERTGIMPRQEVPGHFPKDVLQPQRRWVDADTAHICIGQGEVNVTPLQIAIMVSAVANGGKVLWPRLVQRIEPADPALDQVAEVFPIRPPRNDLGLSARSLQVTRDAMRADVEDEGGTGARSRVAGFRVCGKTGTAQVTNSKGQLIGHTLWYASYAPYESPRYVVIVMVEGSGYGGTICAPAAGRIYQRIHQLEQEGRRTLARNP
ncbi:MAG: Beta-lactamase [Verrucomicrobiota bacterium]|jgi:penicillin-binding protein 2